ncbi:hypothetical protein M9Y10_033571 [Tritrichomonas musculus]|uniref:Uncharacterized protein n=1 Tax=Tritrichomonas musculus TaxID=1915356 RepID=A0ABR2KDJ8_9EUKA
MISNKKEIVILYVKNKGINSSPISKQTKNIREKTNERIRALGNKYYVIKSLFEQSSLKRDAIFSFGKQLENEYKTIKKGIYLQNQSKRMKESLYCWYAENFYEEITQPNSFLLKRIIENSRIISALTTKTNPLLLIQKQNRSSDKKIQNNTQNTQIVEDLQNNTTNATKINQEVDSFSFSNITNDSIGDEKVLNMENENFDFGKLLNF